MLAKILKTFLLAACVATIAQAAAQTIAFDAIPNQILGVSPFVIAAQASSGFPVSFTSTMPAVCKLTDDLVMLLSVGTCSITANQAGTQNYSVASATRSFTVVTAKKSGSFMAAPGSPFAMGTASGVIAAGDFNGDGIPDLVTANSSDGNVTVLLGASSGTFTQAAGSPIAIDSPNTGIAGDFNGDGFEDLAITGGNVVVILLGDGSGGFSAATGSPFAAGSGPGSIAVGDFNGDGIQDLVVINNIVDTTGDAVTVSGAVTVLLGNGSGGFAATPGSPFPVGRLSYGVAVGDFNRDGIQDIATSSFFDQNITVLLGNGSGGFSAATFSPISVGPFALLGSLVVGDFNGDGVQDLAAADQAYNGIRVLPGQASGGFAAQIFSPAAHMLDPTSLVTADFNGDGIEDLATGGFSDSVGILLGTGTGTFVEPPYSPLAGGSGSRVALPTVGDFNGDGIEDIAVVSYPGSGVTVLLGFVPGSTAQSITFGVLGTMTYGVPPFTGSVSATSGLPVSLASISPFFCTISGNTVTLVANGTCSIVASQPGNTIYAPAATVTQSFTVNAEPQTITFGTLPNVAVGTAAFTLNASSDSGLTVSFASTTPVVCSVSGNMVTVLVSGGCSITATQAGDSTYAAVPPATQSFTVFFSDVAPGDSDYAAINALAQRGITSGCGSNGFCPNANVTRDEMAIFIVRAIYGSDNFTYTATPYFTDVTAGTFGFKWIQKLRDLGITGGCTATTYCPGEVVTRDQMAVFIIRARLGLGLAGGPSPTFSYPSTPYFTDATAANEFAFPWIQRMRLDGITSGCTATTYCSTDAVTRGSMAIFIMRGAFNQFLPAGTPVISSVSPATLAVGMSGTFTVTGVNTNFVQGTTVLSPIPGVTIGAVTVASATSLTVQLTAASNAVAQPYSVLAVTGSEQDVLPNGLVLQ